MRLSPGVRRGLPSLSLMLAPGLVTASTMAIEHDSLECWPTDEYAILRAMVAPPGQVRSAKIYFRSEEYPDYYFVEAPVGPDGHAEAVLPLAAPDTRRVVYYLEAVSVDFETTRTREWTPPVSDSEDCRRRDPMLALFEGDAPKILVGSVRAGAPLLPLGFQSAGIVTAGVGGGLSAVAIGGIVAGGAAGGVLVATAGDGAPEVTTSIVSGAPPSSASTAVTTSVPAPATTTAAASGPATTSASTTTTTGAATTTAPAPTTTTSAGAATSTVPASSTTTSVSLSTTTTTVTPTTTTTAPSTTTTSAPATTTTSVRPGADVAISIAAPGTVRFGTLLVYNVRVSNNGPAAATGVRATLSFPFSLTIQDSGFCTGGFGTFQCVFGTLAPGGSASVNIYLIVLQLGTVTASASVSANETDPVPGNNGASATTNVTLFQRESADTVVTVTSHLDIAPGDGRDRGEIVLGSRHFGVDSTGPVDLHAQGQAGENAVEAVLSAGSGRSGTWRFDFRASRSVEAGTIVVDAGEVAALEPRAVVFRLRGEAGERIRFRFRAAER
jgi:hypothetical protein